MQNLRIKPGKTVNNLTLMTLILAGCIGLWFWPTTHNYLQSLDANTAIWLNHSLVYSKAWQLLWGYLNHKNENWLNVIFMMAVNITGIYTLPKNKRPQAAALVVYFWLFFQLVLLATHLIFSDWLTVQRLSPSLVISPWIMLNETLNMDTIKVYSERCFPAGHVLVLVFWAQFTMLYSIRWVRALALATAFTLTLPRLISGAHWPSDVVFTALYATIWFYLAQMNFIFKKITKIKVKNEKSIH